jgi:hypothetical protein
MPQQCHDYTIHFARSAIQATKSSAPKYAAALLLVLFLYLLLSCLLHALFQLGCFPSQHLPLVLGQILAAGHAAHEQVFFVQAVLSHSVPPLVRSIFFTLIL